MQAEKRYGEVTVIETLGNLAISQCVPDIFGVYIEDGYFDNYGNAGWWYDERRMSRVFRRRGGLSTAFRRDRIYYNQRSE